jgi:phosphopantetheine--protein transferase-like protein
MLLRIFSAHDLNFCLEKPELSAQRFASRFAAREATYKALCTYAPMPPPLRMLCKTIEIHTTACGAPQLIIDWHHLPGIMPTAPLLSITHTATTATAIVILQASLVQIE